MEPSAGGGLRRLGKVLHTSPLTGNHIAKLTGDANQGEKVYDAKLRAIGIIYEIFGPVTSPYVAVKPLRKEIKLSQNQTLYVQRGRKRQY